MLSIKQILEGAETITPQAWVNKRDLSKTFLHILDDMNYKLGREFGIKLTPQEICELMEKAIEKYKTYK